MTLKEYLELNGLTVAEMSRALGLPHATVLSYVNRTHEPSLSNALTIEKITLGVVKSSDLIKKEK
jgi:transcriptional regulator with XRE-family HTH domain